jgi:predicted nucleic acid-binding protein
MGAAPAGEHLSSEALELLDAYASNQVQLTVPDLFWPEAGNVLWKCVKLGRIRPQSALDGIHFLRELRLETAPSEPMIEEAVGVAMAFQQTVYDALYVSMAVIRGNTLLTADERLVNSLGSRFPVRWLGNVAFL